MRKILALRDELAAHKGRRLAFAGIGAETIHFELQQRGSQLPTISTIEKILVRADKTEKVSANALPAAPRIPASKLAGWATSNKPTWSAIPISAGGARRHALLFLPHHRCRRANRLGQSVPR